MSASIQHKIETLVAYLILPDNIKYIWSSDGSGRIVETTELKLSQSFGPTGFWRSSSLHHNIIELLPILFVTRKQHKNI